MTGFVKAEGISKNRVRYTDVSGRIFIYSKGTRAWRNNNPGNIRKPGRDTKLEGIIGNAGGFSVFSSLGNCCLVEALNFSDAPKRY